MLYRKFLGLLLVLCILTAITGVNATEPLNKEKTYTEKDIYIKVGGTALFWRDCLIPDCTGHPCSKVTYDPAYFKESIQIKYNPLPWPFNGFYNHYLTAIKKGNTKLTKTTYECFGGTIKYNVHIT
jgi:hypothetical protein